MDVREKTSNEKRLIDANALVSYIDECSQESRFRVYYGYAKSFIDDAPTIDAVPVVRCRECKHLGFCGDATNLEVMGFYGYCSRGERKEGADNDT